MMPELGRALGEGNGCLLQYSYLGNPMVRGVGYSPWHCKELDMIEQLTLLLSHTTRTVMKIRKSTVSCTGKHVQSTTFAASCFHLILLCQAKFSHRSLTQKVLNTGPRDIIKTPDPKICKTEKSNVRSLLLTLHITLK